MEEGCAGIFFSRVRKREVLVVGLRERSLQRHFACEIPEQNGYHLLIYFSEIFYSVLRFFRFHCFEVYCVSRNAYVHIVSSAW